ncbi:ABC-2 transporter permease [Bacillus velezensis]|uniref:ABC-2 transporter permease n=1 Tax=Bacillus velezensis TaxID=492670 RepID=UPI0031EF8A98
MHTRVGHMVSAVIFILGMLQCIVCCYADYLFVVMPALEVIKYESKSGYDRYVLTLPVSRTNMFKATMSFILIVVIGAVISYGIFLVYSLGSDEPIDGIFICLFWNVIVLFAVQSLSSSLHDRPGKIRCYRDWRSNGGTFCYVWIAKCRWVCSRTSTAVIFAHKSFFICPDYISHDRVILYIISFFIAAAIYHKKDFSN